MWTAGSNERRRHERVPAHGSVRFRGNGQEIHCRLMVMSATEVEVRCPLGFELAAMTDAPVDLELFIDEPGGGWLQFRGHVTHLRPGTHSLVIRIDDIPPQLAALLDAHLAGERPIANDVARVDEPTELLPAGYVTRE